MAGQLFTSTVLDTAGRQLVLDDNIISVHYYDSSGEVWDKTGGTAASWYEEVYKPHDIFDSSSISTERWTLVDTPTSSVSTVTQGSGLLTLGIERDEGTVSLSSEGKWSLSGDFDIRLYIDWESYYNEYRGVTDTFLKVGVDDENAARLAFSFDGTSSYLFKAESRIDKHYRFFDWDPNGSATQLSSFTDAEQYSYLRLVRQSGVITCFISTGAQETQVGDSISDAAFSGDLYVEFGIRAPEYNTYRSGFSKFFVASGDISPSTEFFSSVRGTKQSFPDKAILTIDQYSLSIIDEASSSLWMRFLFGALAPLIDSNVKVHACNGVIYCATSQGLVVLDFVQDAIYRYSGSDIYLADEPLAMRNADPYFRSYIADFGQIPDDNLHDVSCRSIAGQTYVAFVNDSGVSVIRPLASGISNSADGPQPGSLVDITERGALYWSGYDSINNDGELSYFSNIAALTTSGTDSFSRTGYYGTDTTPGIFGSNIAAFSTVSSEGVDIAAVGTSEGATFIGLSPATPYTKAISYGVEAPADNPFADPSFDEYLGIYWLVGVTGFHEIFDVRRVSPGLGGDTYAVRIGYDNPATGQDLQIGDSIFVYQTVDLTGVSTVYFNISLSATSGFSPDTNIWDFNIYVGSTLVKNYKDVDGPFTKLNDSFDTSSFSGKQEVKFSIETVVEHNLPETSQRVVTLGGIKTKIGNPDYRILPAGNSAIQEVLLQYDTEGHKIYFSSAGGYGAIDLDDSSLDYFVPLDTYGPDAAENLSGDFSRVTDET